MARLLSHLLHPSGSKQPGKGGTSSGLILLPSATQEAIGRASGLDKEIVCAYSVTKNMEVVANAVRNRVFWLSINS